MKLLFASDSFKGSLSSQQTALLLTEAAHRVWGDAVRCESLPMADGGEGTIEAIIEARGGHYIPMRVEGPLGTEVQAGYGCISAPTSEQGGEAIIEMARASGLPLVPPALRNPLCTSTYGTGQLIRDALDRGFRRLYIAIGGSATNDGGMGCMRALGVRFLDSEGTELAGRGEDLERLCTIDTTQLDPRIGSCQLVVMCDVDNPLCGPEGATHTFSAQKGATPAVQERLERGMQHYRDVIISHSGINPDTIPGSGAAGGLGAALLVFLGAKLLSGIEAVLEATRFDQRLQGVDLVITGEGRTDWQSCRGKVVQGVGDHCLRHQIPAIALVGSTGPGAEEVLRHGITRIVTTAPEGMPLTEAMARAEELYLGAAIGMFEAYGIDYHSNF